MHRWKIVDDLSTPARFSNEETIEETFLPCSLLFSIVGEERIPSSSHPEQIKSNLSHPTNLSRDFLSSDTLTPVLAREEEELERVQIEWNHRFADRGSRVGGRSSEGNDASLEFVVSRRGAIERS